MFVKAAHRGKGIGIEILKELKKWSFDQITPNYSPYIGNECLHGKKITKDIYRKALKPFTHL